MLGMSAASVYVATSKRLTPAKSYFISGILCVLTALSVILLFVFSTQIKNQINLLEIAKLKQEGFQSFINFIRDSEFQCSLMIGLVMSIPYMLVGGVLSIVFRSCASKDFHKLYFIDLLGACLGCVAAVVALELFESFSAPLILSIALPLFAAIAFFSHSKPAYFKATILASIVISFLLLDRPELQKFLEPQPNIQRLARLGQGNDYSSAKEIWRTWTSYGRISAFERAIPLGNNNFANSYVMVHGNGEGHAHITDVRRTGVRMDTKLAIASCDPKQVLVIFAGAGNDMAQFDRLTQSQARITGVELVSQVSKWPLSQSQFKLKELFSKPNMNLVTAEGREYLARDKTKYDCILASWSGASTSYYTGTAAHAASYVYTTEGLTSMLDHLTPGGQLTLLNGSKIRIIFSLKEYFKKLGINDISDKVVIVSSIDNASPKDWRNLVDNQILLVKPAGFTSKDFQKIASIRPITYSKDYTAQYAEDYEKAIKATEINGLLSSWKTDFLIEMSPATDDKPFRGNLFPSSAYLTSQFWSGKVENGQWKVNLMRAKTMIWFIVIALVLIISPLFLKKNNISWSSTTRMSLAYFGLVGLAFMIMEVGLVMKLMLLTGHPGYTIGVVLASLVLFTGIGSLLSDFVIKNKILTLRGACIAAGVSILIALCLASYANTNLVGLPRFAKLLLAFLIPALPAVFMGHLFPQGLTRIGKINHSLIPWAIAINGATGTIASGLSPILMEVAGVNSLIISAALLYFLLAALSSKSIFR